MYQVEIIFICSHFEWAARMNSWLVGIAYIQLQDRPFPERTGSSWLIQ